MRLRTGTLLGPYEVLAPVGSGGMGEVYRARDRRLGRTVALKLLNERFSDRTRREARAISALNHPGICQLYDICTDGDLDFLVMEYIDGETLADRLGRGRLNPQQAIQIGVRIAEALEAAHTAGVIHRDLKPANVMMTASSVKLVDFGVADQRAATTIANSNSPTATVTVADTGAGRVAGTIPYMAPEQFEGKPADERTDIFALGILLYEMITGERPFSGSTAAAVAANIIGAEPRPLSSVQPSISGQVDRIVQTCLAKDPEQRWRRAFDVGIALRSAGNGPPARPRASGWPTTVAIAAVAIAAAALGWYILRTEADPEPFAFSITAPPGGHFIFGDGIGGFAISPDGRTVAFVAESDGQPTLWTRPLGSAVATRVPGTEYAAYPFWAPDSRSVAFFARGKLKKVRVAGGPVEVICPIEAPRGGTWNGSGDMLFVPGPGQAGRIHLVKENGGAVTTVTSFDATRQEEAHYFPQFLPDGRRFLMWIRSANKANTGLYISSLDMPSERIRIADATSSAMLQPAHGGHPGYLAWLRGRTLIAQQFDARSGTLRDRPRTISEDVGSFEAIGLGNFSLSTTGLLMYGRQGVDNLRLTWLESTGNPIRTISEPGAYFEPRLSPDGTRLAVRISSAEASHIWVVDMRNGSKARITFGSLTELSPVWSPDGQGIAFTTTKAGMRVIAVKMFESPDEEVQISSGNAAQYPTSWSPDGRYIAFHQLGEDSADIYVVSPTAPGQAIPLLRTPASENEAQFSPNGAWMAYQSDETGRPEIYVQRFAIRNGTPELSRKSQISTSGGEHPRWSHDGRQLFFVALNSTLTSVPVEMTKETFNAGPSRPLFKLPVVVVGRGTTYDVGMDDRTFIIDARTDDAAEAEMSGLLHWPEMLLRTGQ